MFYIPILTLPDLIFTSPLLAILVPLTLGWTTSFLAAYLSGGDSKRFKKVPIQPPDYVFGIVWTILYILMGYASFRAFTTGTAASTSLFLPSDADTLRAENARIGATVYTVQLVINLLYSPLFFWIRSPWAAIVDVVALAGAVVYLAGVWFEVDFLAGALLLPYLSWLAFATYVTVETCKVNDWNLSPAAEKGKKSQ